MERNKRTKRSELSIKRLLNHAANFARLILGGVHKHVGTTVFDCISQVIQGVDATRTSGGLEKIA